MGTQPTTLPDKNVRLFFAFDSGTAHYMRNVSGGTEVVGIDVHTGQFRAERIVLSTVKYAAGFRLILLK